MKKHLSTVLLLLVLLAGVALLLYPTASDYWNSFHQSRAIAGYAESVSGLNAVDYEHIWRSARDYNARLLERANPFRVLEEDEADYNGELNVGNNGIMGYIEIPGIEVSLPIYHGTSDGVLQVAVGHLQGSSLPVGGPSTHCVLSGHRGLPSAKLFTNLDQLAEGDIFMLRILNETLTYEVDQIHIVLPDEMGNLVVQEGQDHCTLVTCTPYGINTHRLLVRGKRIETPEAASSARITADAVRIDPILVAPVAAAPMLLALFIWAIAAPGGGKKKSSGKRVKKQS